MELFCEVCGCSGISGTISSKDKGDVAICGACAKKETCAAVGCSKPATHVVSKKAPYAAYAACDFHASFENLITVSLA